MGQKVNPHGLRVGVNKKWNSEWVTEKNYSKWLKEDYDIRKIIQNNVKDEILSKVIIKRIDTQLNIEIFSSAPPLVMGKEQKNLHLIIKKIKKISSIKNVKVNIIEVSNPNLDAQLVAENIARQIENRVSFRVAQKKAISAVMAARAKGIKTAVSGRLGGVEMARREGYTRGTVPRQTLRSDLDYGFAEASTTYGIIGVKVWICKGHILNPRKEFISNELEAN